MSQPATRAVREPNPATFYIVVFLLIGSQAIQMIALRKDYTALVRRADAKISLLNDVIRRVQEGEEVDVEGILGTGDPVKEAEWEEVIKQIENEELWPKKTKRSGTVSQYAAGTSKPESTDVKQSEGSSDVSPESQRASDEIVAFTKAPRGFY
ncbi:MAG: hypothetical protein M1833_004970 [Piccolia ochrophora]|nr:MAG: hypothetical protein M1833_004970 [Piccolia ochrophora]